MSRSKVFSSMPLIVAASIVVVIFGLKAASAVVAPLMMAVFVAIVCSPAVYWLQRHRVPNALALLIVLAAIALTGGLVISWVSGAIAEISQELPGYKDRLTTLYGQLTVWMATWGVVVPDVGSLDIFSPDKFVTLLNHLLNGLSGLIGDAFVVFLAVLFLLIDASHFPEKMREIFINPDESMGRLTEFVDTVLHYLGLKSITSVITALFVALLLWALDYDFIVLWSILAFMLNFVPYVGSLMAAVPPIVLGLIDHGAVSALTALLGYVAINVIVGQIVETRLIGNKMNLSSFVVFVSLTFWGWVLGPVGMFLSIPLTMLLLIALESNQNTRRYAILLKG